jgi:hypothetical protein
MHTWSSDWKRVIIIKVLNVQAVVTSVYCDIDVSGIHVQVMLTSGLWPKSGLGAEGGLRNSIAVSLVEVMLISGIWPKSGLCGLRNGIVVSLVDVMLTSGPSASWCKPPQRQGPRNPVEPLPWSMLPRAAASCRVFWVPRSTCRPSTLAVSSNVRQYVLSLHGAEHVTLSKPLSFKKETCSCIMVLQLPARMFSASP